MEKQTRGIPMHFRDGNKRYCSACGVRLFEKPKNHTGERHWTSDQSQYEEHPDKCLYNFGDD